jgi:hypothetical protein
MQKIKAQFLTRNTGGSKENKNLLPKSLRQKKYKIKKNNFRVGLITNLFPLSL